MKTFNESQRKRNADGKRVFLYYQQKTTSKSIPRVDLFIIIIIKLVRYVECTTMDY